MFSFAMGALSAGSLGIADFIASQSSERLGAARALGGMLLVSSIALTVVVIANEGFALHLQHESLIGNVLAAMHGSVMAIALLFFSSPSFSSHIRNNNLQYQRLEEIPGGISACKM